MSKVPHVGRSEREKMNKIKLSVERVGKLRASVSNRIEKTATRYDTVVQDRDDDDDDSTYVACRLHDECVHSRV
jgi:hypothetical protein